MGTISSAGDSNVKHGGVVTKAWEHLNSPNELELLKSLKLLKLLVDKKPELGDSLERWQAYGEALSRNVLESIDAIRQIDRS